MSSVSEEMPTGSIHNMQLEKDCEYGLRNVSWKGVRLCAYYPTA
ncbi:hypothetical protein [Parachlamydia sp.]|nr:hypothetical protein pah_c200o167 [Parachlamydia acanthamoebae str. Hall's coccus]